MGQVPQISKSCFEVWGFASWGRGETLQLILSALTLGNTALNKFKQVSVLQDFTHSKIC